MVAPILVISGPSGAGKTTVGHLVATAFDPSVHLRTDDFMSCFVNGWVDPSGPDATYQNRALGAAVASAALQLALGDYTVILDGHFFPDGIEGMGQLCQGREVPLHYVILRPDLATCVARATQRSAIPDMQSFAQLHARFAALGDREAKVIDASPQPEAVAERVLAAFSSGTLLEEAHR